MKTALISADELAALRGRQADRATAAGASIVEVDRLLATMVAHDAEIAKLRKALQADVRQCRLCQGTGLRGDYCPQCRVGSPDDHTCRRVEITCFACEGARAALGMETEHVAPTEKP